MRKSDDCFASCIRYAIVLVSRELDPLRMTGIKDEQALKYNRLSKSGWQVKKEPKRPGILAGYSP